MAYGSGNISTTRTSTTKMKESRNVSNQLTKPLLTSKPTSSLNTEAERQSVTLVREQFDKNAFEQTVNTQFTQLGVQEPDLSFFDPNLANVGDFFESFFEVALAVLYFELECLEDLHHQQSLAHHSQTFLLLMLVLLLLVFVNLYLLLINLSFLSGNSFCFFKCSKAAKAEHPH